jgi:hypothetical protein
MNHNKTVLQPQESSNNMDSDETRWQSVAAQPVELIHINQWMQSRPVAR